MGLANTDATHRWFVRAYGALCKDCGMERHDSPVADKYFLDGALMGDGKMPRCPNPVVKGVDHVPRVQDAPVRKLIRRTPV